jgi:hypothetical protein
MAEKLTSSDHRPSIHLSFGHRTSHIGHRPSIIRYRSSDIRHRLNLGESVIAADGRWPMADEPMADEPMADGADGRWPMTDGR